MSCEALCWQCSDICWTICVGGRVEEREEQLRAAEKGGEREYPLAVRDFWSGPLPLLVATHHPAASTTSTVSRSP